MSKDNHRSNWRGARQYQVSLDEFEPPAWHRRHSKSYVDHRHRRLLESPWLLAGLIGVLLALSVIGYSGDNPLASGSCTIKGNIAATGERIYHLPQQKYCAATCISFFRDERWFCSEAEVRNAGWGRARI